MSWLLCILLYVSATVFMAGMGWRLFTWLRAPVPLKIVLTPASTNAIGVVARIAAEGLLLRGLFRGNRSLWAAAWLFHLSLLLLVVGHFGGLVAPEFTQAFLGLTAAQYRRLAQITGDVFGTLAALPLIWLLLRRLVSERVRYFSTFADYWALFLLLLVIATGMQMRLMPAFELGQARAFISGVLSFSPVPAPAGNAFVVHVGLVCALVVYIPFSKLVHLGGLPFSPTLNQRNNPRQERYA